ncbi:hypothetical protein N0824_02052 [Microcystis sp. 0824]|jgi:hypothetical protein|uniref:Uncharacterized protein n=1 Tax=Microcystis aeruginosa NIES-44 TaxID=449439 RepID=A0A0A1VYC7_MICAE|nr:hypothetical protein N44_03028 [Microcystis aeruginosa NIES-44]GBF54192.1 hypothetical protein N0824_02052 [Microcystis sp. 0824]
MEFWAYSPMTLTEFGLLAGLLVPGILLSILVMVSFAKGG